MPRPALPGLVAVVASFALVFGCQDQMRAEKRAEEMSAAKASASAAASASNAEPDPKEAKYAMLRKNLKDRTLAYLTALQKIYTGVPEEERKAFANYFLQTKEAQKEAEDISKEAAFTGKAGMAIKRFEVADLNIDEKLTTATVDVSEEESQRGKPRCIIYKLVWKDVSGTWLRAEKTKVQVVPCTQ